MSERTSGQETGPTAPSVPQNANTGTSDAERIAALEAELAEARILLREWVEYATGISPLDGLIADTESVLARPAGTAAARVIDPEQDRAAFEAALSTWNHHERLVKGSTAARFFFDAALAYERSRS